MNRTLASLALALVLAGCSFGVKPAGATTGRLAGHVTVRICGGANTENKNACQQYPSPGLQLAFSDALGTHVFRATTDLSGGYGISLPPGRYQVAVEPGDPARPARQVQGPPRFVTVVGGKTLTADFGYTVQLL